MKKRARDAGGSQDDVDDDAGYGADGLSWEAVLQCMQVRGGVVASAVVFWFAGLRS